MRFSIYTRTLMPSYLYQSGVLAWECSVCRKLFCQSLEEAERVPVTSPPAQIHREFRVHSCELVLFSRQEKHDAASANPLIFESLPSERRRS